MAPKKTPWISASFKRDNPTQVSFTRGMDSKIMRECGTQVPSPIGMVSKRRRVAADDWLREYSPKTPQDLAVHKSKLDQLKAWLEETNKPENKASISLLTGPVGCGKSTALRVIAEAEGFEVIEWSTPLDIEHFEYGEATLMQSQTSKFEEFLFCTGRYTSVLGFGKNLKRLILVKDFPNIFVLQPALLQNILRTYQTTGRSPLVFSVSEGLDKHNAMFPKHFLDELHIYQISFNKIPNKPLMKALKAVCAMKGDDVPVPKDALNKIIENAQGDIRNAILQLSYVFSQYDGGPQDLLPTIRNITVRKRKPGSKACATPCTGISQKNVYLSVFHRVGRLLYPKTDDSGELTHDPEEIVEQSISEPQRFVSMVHENYPKIFNDMNAICRAMEYASDADIMMAEFRERDRTLPVALSIITRGFMTSGATANRQWTPLTNKEHALVKKREQEMKEMALGVNPKYSLIPRDAAMDILPFTCPGYALQAGLHGEVNEETVPYSDEEEPEIADGNKIVQEKYTVFEVTGTERVRASSSSGIGTTLEQMLGFK